MSPRMAGSGFFGLLCVALACTAVPPPSEGGIPSSADTRGEELVPAGYGTLIQDAFSLTLFHGELRIKVTPLAESVIRLAAPDTYQRLTDLASTNRSQLEARSGVPGVSLFLVSFFTRSPNMPFEPTNLHLLNRGIRFRPLEFLPISPGFGGQRLIQEETQLAIYAFAPEVDLEIDLAVEYLGIENAGWSAILTRLREERSRVRARARGPGSIPP